MDFKILFHQLFWSCIKHGLYYFKFYVFPFCTRRVQFQSGGTLFFAFLFIPFTSSSKQKAFTYFFSVSLSIINRKLILIVQLFRLPLTIFSHHTTFLLLFFILSLGSETYLSGISLPTFTTLSFEVQLITGYVHNLPPSRILYSLNYSFPFVNFFVFVFGIS